MFGFVSFGQLNLVWALASCFTCYIWNHFTSSCMYRFTPTMLFRGGKCCSRASNLLICNFHSSSTGLPTASAFMGPFSRLHSLLQVLAWQRSYFRNQTSPTSGTKQTDRDLIVSMLCRCCLVTELLTCSWFTSNLKEHLPPNSQRKQVTQTMIPPPKQ